SIWKNLKRVFRFGRVLWTAYIRLFPEDCLSSGRPVDMSRLFAGVPSIACTVIRKGKFAQYFRPEDVTLIRAFDLDFILRFAFGIIRGDILQAARYGVWSFHHGDETRFRGSPPGFWEIYFNEAVTGAVLQRLTERLDGGIILQRCFVATHK